MSVKANLDQWRGQLMTSIPVGGLISRNPTVYKWKSPFRTWVLREAVAWRILDLLDQSYSLYDSQHILGARILLRSSFETLGVLVYLNSLMEKVVASTMSFEEFGQKTTAMLLGSKNKSTELESINVVTILQKADIRYPGVSALYGRLSESAHPSYEGFVAGYSAMDPQEFETRFSNRWLERYGSTHLEVMEQCMLTFHFEYNEVWPERMDRLEAWIEQNDSRLDARLEE
ncbi:MAG: hypothetical protein ACO1OG_06080 [Devosia sp.]